MPSHKIITGILSAPAIRYEFSEWINDPQNDVQVSLFVLALNKFMEMNYEDRDSFFQIGGIHGFPNVPWDNTPSENGEGFYCRHGMYNFPTWHRPYLVLYEQRIWETMKQVVIPELNIRDPVERGRWEAEADKWRLPYWDWARRVTYPATSTTPAYTGFGLPYMCTQPEWDIVMPGGDANTRKTPTQNPMWAYRGDGLVMGDPSRGQYAIQQDQANDDPNNPIYFPWDQCYGTSRYAVHQNETNVQCKNNYTGANKAIVDADFYPPPGSDGDKNPIPHTPNSLPDKVYRLLTDGYLETWGSFSTAKHNPNRPPQSWEDYLSLEYIHNNLHNWTGGGDLGSDLGAGHMCDVPVAGFDPIFYLHHCNIDRLCAIWQTLNPDHWFDDLYFDPNDPKDTPIDATTQLLPFRGEGEKVFDSNDVRYWTKFHYQYKILVKGEGEDEEAYRRRITIDIADLYNDSASHIVKAAALTQSLKASPVQQTGQTSEDTTQKPIHDAPESASAKAPEYNDYIINVLYDRYGYGRGVPYTLHFFIANAGESAIEIAGGTSSQDLRADKRHVGSISTFSTRLVDEHGETICENCAKQEAIGAMSEAQLPLTLELVHRAQDDSIEFSDVDPGSVAAYLSENLTWVAVNSLGQVIPHEVLNRTKAWVLAGKTQQNTTTGSAGNPITTFGGYKAILEAISTDLQWTRY